MVTEKIALWAQSSESAWAAHVIVCEQPARIRANGTLHGATFSPPNSQEILVRPVRPVETSIIGLVMVPRSGMIAINGAARPAGVHGLRHGDSLVVASRPFYVSLPLIATESHYDPAVHPAEAYCFITKARLAPHDPVTICPGTAAQSCGYLYKRDAWNQVMSQPGTKCAHCGFHPTLAQWKPPAAKGRPTCARLERLLAVMRTSGASTHRA